MLSLWVMMIYPFSVSTGVESKNAKLDPVLKEMIGRMPNDRQVSVDVFIRTSNAEALKQQGVLVRTVAGDVVTASIPFSRITAISELSSVEYIEASRICRPLLDESIPEIGADKLWNGFFGTEFRGQGVIVGIYDSGIDWSHPDFIDENENSRILYLWDQTFNDAARFPAGFAFGAEYTQGEINDEIDGSPTGIVRGKDEWGHGTHVAGIAAGNGRAADNGKPSGVYVGVAPEADLIVVKGGIYEFNDLMILEGIDYIFGKADLLNRPAVVNLSVGQMHKGPHDGTSGFEKGISNRVSWIPGRAVVIAAGNDGNNPVHFGKAYSTPGIRDTLEVTFSINQNQQGSRDYVHVDVWYPATADLRVTVTTPGNISYGPVSSRTSQTFNTNDGRVYVDNASGGINGQNGDMEMLIQVSDIESNGDVTDNLATGNWTLFFTGLLLIDNRNEVERFDGWLSESSILNNAYITSGAEQSRLVAEPGNARLSITVGSYVSRNSWPSLFKDPYSPGGLTVGALSSLSSPGPTRDDRLKPDIVAPGEYILSSLSSFVSVLPAENLIATDMVHWAMRGTSMAAPHVTGAVALLFQADPYQTSSDIKDKLIKSARLDDWTGYDVWTQERGYGKLDALEAMREITGCEEADIGMPDSYRLYPNYPNPFNGLTIIEYDVPSRIGGRYATVSLDIYDLRGRCICPLFYGQRQPGRHRAAWDGRDGNGVRVASGVYVYRLAVGETMLSRKMVFLQ